MAADGAKPQKSAKCSDFDEIWFKGRYRCCELKSGIEILSSRAAFNMAAKKAGKLERCPISSQFDLKNRF